VSYESTRSLRFYPGASMPEGRQEAILSFEVPLDNTTVEDILFNTARAVTGTFYGLLAIVEERFGKEAAQTVAREFGYRGGHRNIPAWLAAHGRSSGSAELMAAYQDYAHAMRGPDHADATSEHDGTTCTVIRRKCGWHTGKPADIDSYCGYASEGFLQAYKECDPGLESAAATKCMSWGDDHCQHVFIYSQTEAPIE
jgi:hypothetical protein